MDPMITRMSIMLSQEWLCGECGKDYLVETRKVLECQYCSSINVDHDVVTT